MITIEQYKLNGDDLPMWEGEQLLTSVSVKSKHKETVFSTRLISWDKRLEGLDHYISYSGFNKNHVRTFAEGEDTSFDPKVRSRLVHVPYAFPENNELFVRMRGKKRNIEGSECLIQPHENPDRTKSTNLLLLRDNYLHFQFQTMDENLTFDHAVLEIIGDVEIIGHK